ncbi:hypothetical protein DXG01_014028 [Tephrocybe rancida]|nr:hypothetical protein DXG01_014028 [Tephrocybe rancida]
MAGYWISYSLYEGPLVINFCRIGSLVSVVLDDDARFHFSAIQLIIVSKDDDITLNSREFLPHAQAPTPKITYMPGYRHKLAKQRDLRRSNLEYSNSSTLPLCTITLELQRTEDAEPHYTYIIRRATDSSVSGLRVVYDYMQPCNPEQPAFFLYLTGNACIAPLPRHCHNFQWGQFGLPVYMFRVKLIPGAHCHGKIGKLPANLVRRIAELSITNKPFGWRQTLLSYGLVCKAWTHVLDLFFLSFQDKFVGSFDMPDICAVARSLDARPERGSLMSAFSMNDFRAVTSSDVEGQPSTQYSLAFSTVLGHASPTLLKTVRFHHIPATVAEDVRRGLDRLQGLEKLALGGRRSADEIHLDLDTIQTLMSKWPNLRQASLSRWLELKAPKQARRDSPPPFMMCQLEILALEIGTIQGPQLMQFVAVPYPCLRVFRLYKVQGLWNHDLKLFLSTVAATLEQLRISECEVHRASDAEELAIDAIMPMFSALYLLNVRGISGIVSALAISRKRVEDAEPGIRSCLTLHGVHADEMNEEEVMQALEVTGWSSADVMWPESETRVHWQHPSRTYLPGKGCALDATPVGGYNSWWY